MTVNKLVNFFKNFLNLRIKIYINKPKYNINTGSDFDFNTDIYTTYLGKVSNKTSKHYRRKKAMVNLHKNNELWCGYCKEQFDFVKKFPTIDHIIPKIKNGAEKKENLTPCCKSCNMKKADNVWIVKYPNKGFGIYGVCKPNKLKGV